MRTLVVGVWSRRKSESKAAIEAEIDYRNPRYNGGMQSQKPRTGGAPELSSSISPSPSPLYLYSPKTTSFHGATRPTMNFTLKVLRKKHLTPVQTLTKPYKSLQKVSLTDKKCKLHKIYVKLHKISAPSHTPSVWPTRGTFQCPLQTQV